MKFKFPLQNVMKHRKVLEDLAQRDYQEANAKLNEEEQKLAKLYEAVDLARQFSFKTQVQGGSAGSALSQVHEFLKGQDIRIEQQKKAIDQQRKIVEDFQEILRQRAVEYKIIEKYKDRKLEEFKVEKNKKEQKVADDIVSTRHLMKVRE